VLTPEQWTLLGMVSLIAGAGLRRLWVFGWTYADKVKDLSDMTVDRNFWRDTALRSMGHVDKALGGKDE
jgi:hypothetical protein